MKTLAFVNNTHVVAIDDYDNSVNPSASLRDITSANPMPEVGWPLFEGNIVQPYVLDKVQWLKRLTPFWTEYEAAQTADATVRMYTKMFDLEPAINLRRTETIAMLTDFANRIIAANPNTTLTANILTDYGNTAEQYKGK